MVAAPARQSHSPAMPPNRIAAIWATEEVLNRMISAATTAMEARSRSGHSVRAMPQTACATIATATSLQAMEQPDADRAAERTRAIGEEHEGDGGRQRKAGPCRETAAIAGPHEADGKSDLAAGGAGQELAQPHEIGIGLLVEPAAAHDELFAEIPDVSDRPAEAGDAQLEEDKENFERRTCLPVFSRGRVRGDRHRGTRFLSCDPVAYA